MTQSHSIFGTNYGEHQLRMEINQHWGGLINSDLAETIQSHQSPNLLNCRPLGLGKWGPRNGIARVGNATAGAGKCAGLYTFALPNSEILVRADDNLTNQILQYLDAADNTWKNVLGATTLTTGKEIGFVNDISFLYFGNGVNAFARWDGVAADTIATYAGNPKGNIYAFYIRRLLIAGDPAAPAVLYYSKTGNAIDFTFSAPRLPDDGGSILLGDGGDAITAIKTLITPSGASSAIVFKKSTRIYDVTFAVDGTPTVKEIKTGTGSINNRSATIVENDIMYVDGAGKGVIRALGFKENIQNDLQTMPLSDFIDAETPDYDFSVAAGIYFKKESFAIITAKSYQATQNDTAFVHYRKYKSWWRWNGINATQFAIYGGLLCWSNAFDRNVYQLTTAFDDLGNPISVLYDTYDADLSDIRAIRRARLLGLAMRMKQCRFLFLAGYISPGGTLTVRIIFDADESKYQEKTIKGTDGVVDQGVSISFGSNVQGNGAFGGSAQSATNFPMSPFIARLSFDAYSFFKMRVRVISQGAGTPFLVTKYLPWVKLMPDEYFPDVKKA